MKEKIPVVICGTAARMPAMLQAFSNKHLFTMEGSSKDATNLIKLLQEVDNRYRLLLLLDSEIALRNNAQLLSQLYRQFAGLKVITILNTSNDLIDIMKICHSGFNYFLRSNWLENINLYLAILMAGGDHYTHMTYRRSYEWLKDSGELVVFDYSTISHLGFLMQNKSRDEIVDLTGETEDQLDSQMSFISKSLDKLQLIENCMRSGIGVKYPARKILMLKQSEGVFFVHIDNILKIEAKNDYVYVHHVNGSISSRCSATIKHLKKLTIGTPVVKINNYTMININYVRYIKADVISIGDENEETLSPLCRKDFLRRLGD